MRLKRRRGGAGIQNRESIMDSIRYFALLVMLIIPRIIYGFKYFPVVDDWFLYYGSSIKTDHSVNLASRPFAALTDRYILTPMADHMIVAQIILMILLAAAAYMLYKAFESSRIAVGAFFVLMIAMPPAGFEGVYWVSAASRIVPSVFFISLALYSECRYIITNKKRYIILTVAAGIMSVGFYEMMIPVYFVATAAAALIQRKKQWIITVPAALTIVAMLYYKLNGDDPSISDRVMFVEAEGFFQHIADLFKDYRILFTEIQKQLLSESIRDGLSAFNSKPILIVPAAAAAAVFAFTSDSKKGCSIITDIGLGICLILAAVSVNVIMAYIRLPFRVAYPVCIGAALIAETLLSRIKPKLIYQAFVFCISVLCMISSAGQVSLYRYVHNNDIKYCDMLMQDEKIFDKGYLTYIFNERKYCYNDHLQYWEYIKSADESYAAITGMIKYRSGIADINNVMPVHENDIVKDYDYDGADMNLLYIDSKGEIKKCRAVSVGDNYNIESESGEFIGSLTREGEGYRYNEYII